MNREKTKRYNLIVPHDDFEKVKARAEDNSVSATSVIIQFVKLGLAIEKATSNGGAVIKREGGKDTELLIL